MVNLILHAGGAGRGPLFIVRDGTGEPLVVGVDGGGRLRLLQRAGAGAWRDIDLTDALPGGGTVRCGDVRQAPDGTIAIALWVKHADGTGTLHMATGLPAGQDAAAWGDAIRQLPAVPGLPAGAWVKRLDFGLLQAGAPPLLLIEAATGHAMNTWYCNAAAPEHTMRPLHLPAAQARAIGSFRQPGGWTLHTDGGTTALRFTPLNDPFGWDVDLQYPQLPPGTASVLLAPGALPNVPDLYAAGERIVVYRGGNTLPRPVAEVAGARLVWNHAHAGTEYLAYADSEGALWLVVRPPHGGWSAPFRLTRRRAVLAVAGQFIHAVAVEESDLEVQRFTMDGQLYGSEIVAAGWSAP